MKKLPKTSLMKLKMAEIQKWMFSKFS